MNTTGEFQPTGRSIILKMNRPQYVSVPEGFISSLAWKMFEWDASAVAGQSPIGLIFLAKQESASKNFELRETAPKGGNVDRFGESLKEEGIGPETLDSSSLAQAVVNSVTGIRAEKSTIQAASPLTPGFALLQNMRGVQKSKNPPDLAEILESLYRYGVTSATTSAAGVASRWLDAASHRCTIDPLLASMDRAVRETLLGHNLRSSYQPSEGVVGQGLFGHSPFSWFARSWDRITSEAWVNALPARVWVDWATMILRLSLGTGFLWEAAWYETLARKILSEQSFSWRSLLNDMPHTLPWKSSRSAQAVRDVASPLMWRVHKGAAIRKTLEDWLAYNAAWDTDFEELTPQMQADSELEESLTEALGSQKKMAPNTWEAIKYALMTRDEAGPYADYYGLLRRRGRYLTVEPGTEWIAVIASLACEEPGGTENVGRLMSDFSELGLSPEIADVIALLERAGLARGSADADQGVLIKSAF